jgi:hypothetical protein
VQLLWPWRLTAGGHNLGKAAPTEPGLLEVVHNIKLPCPLENADCLLQGTITVVQLHGYLQVPAKYKWLAP